MKRKPFSYRIGIFTVVMVLVFVVVIWSAVTYSNLVFMKLSQNTVGEADLTMVPKSASDVYFTGDHYAYPTGKGLPERTKPEPASLPLINYTHVNELMANESDYAGFAPRWILLTELHNVTDFSKKSGCVTMILNTKLERDIGLG